MLIETLIITNLLIAFIQFRYEAHGLTLAVLALSYVTISLINMGVH